MLQGIEHEFRLVDTLKEENKKEAYLAQSFCETIPMLSNNMFKVIGGDSTALKFLKNAYPDVKKELYSKEQEAKIDKHLLWYQSKLRPETQRLIRMIVLPKVVSTNVVKADDLKTHWDFIFGEESII
jgi:glutathione S-transferase